MAQLATQDLTSYYLVTAENILKRYGILLSQEEIKSLMHDEQSFYRELIRLPAAQAYQNLLIEQLNQILDVAREELSSLLIYHYRRQASENSNLELPMTVQEASTEYERISKAITTLTEEYHYQQHQIDITITRLLKQWKQSQRDISDDIVIALRENVGSYSRQFSDKLYQHLESNSANITIAPEVLSALGLKEAPPVLKALLATFSEEVLS